jgi:predicted amidohydrolase
MPAPTRQPRTLSLGVCQTSTPPYDADGGRRACLDAAAAAFDAGAEMVLLPELVVPGYGSDGERMRALAEPLSGPTVRAWAALAAAHDGYVAGGFCERDGDAIYNTAVVVGPRGVALHYRKLHLFAEEMHAFAPGDLGLPVLDTPFGRIGLCVCYDLRFVETVRILALRGVELLLVPTAWVPGFDDRLWDEAGMAAQAQGVIVQANLNQIFIACASHAGRFDGTVLLGSSLVVDPVGQVIAGPMAPDRDDLAVVAIDLEAGPRARERAPLIRPREDRRTDVYAVAIDGEML